MIDNLPTISDKYKGEVRKSVLSIILFFTIYFLLIGVSLAFVIWVITIAFTFVKTSPGFWSILLGIAMVGMSSIVFIFLIKFLFNNNAPDYTRVQITADKEPELFALINKTVEAVGAPYPKKVYLTTDVNAFVNYDSTFWSMFLPVKKNLTIGLGLINSSTVSELQAVLAHEFGHFSQRSMKVGSYTNQAQKMIYDMLHNNDKFYENVSKFASIHAFVSLFVMLSMYFIRGIQWILAHLFDFLFLKHLSLSREMEFNADAIATHVVGSQVFSNSLLRMDLADLSFNKPLNFFYQKNEEYFTQNLYKDQSILLDFYAKEYQHEVVNQLPKVTLEESEKYNLSKLKIEDKWSSHPSTTDRVNAITSANITLPEVNNALAKSLLKNFDKYGEYFTNKLYSINKMTKKGEEVSPERFLELFEKEHKDYSFPKMFNSYYSDHNALEVDLADKNLDNNFVFSELFTDEKVNLIYEKNALQNDIATLEAIIDKRIKLKSFEYDSARYPKNEATKIKKNLQARLEEVKNLIKANDQKIYQYFNKKSLAKGENDLYYNTYQKLLDADNVFKDYHKKIGDFLPSVGFISERLQVEEIYKRQNLMFEKQRIFIDDINTLLDKSIYTPYVNEDDRKNLEAFTKENIAYFNRDEYRNDRIALLNNAVDAYYNVIYNCFFKIKKEWLELQESIETTPPQQQIQNENHSPDNLG